MVKEKSKFHNINENQHSHSRSSSIDKKEKYNKNKSEELETHWSNKPLNKMTDRDWRIYREDNDIIIKGGRVPHPIRSWEESGLPEYIIKALEDAEYKKPTPIQIQGIPIGLEKRDMIGLAPTGSGKSAAFIIPLIIYLNNLPAINQTNSNLGPYSLILAPSRELAQQIFETFNKFSTYTKLRAALIIGGKSSEEQAFNLGLGVEVIIATPGRMQDCLERQYTVLSQCHYIVFDEADKMIKDGYEESLKYILDSLPDTNLKSSDEKIVEIQEKECKEGTKHYRITMMFSATMNPSLEKLARTYLRCPSYISIGDPGSGKKEIKQKIELVSENSKRTRIRNILDKTKPPIMIFVNHKKEADSLAKYLDKMGFRASSLHGSKIQEQREKALNGFKQGKYKILVCTDVAGRGIDVEGINMVINYDCPKDIDDYTHRIGRTGRSGRSGTAITFLTNEDEKIYYDLVEFFAQNKQSVPQELLDHPSSRIKKGKNV